MPLRLFRQKPAPPSDADLATISAAPKGGATMTTATLHDQLFVTYAVPPERIAALLPVGLTPDRLPSAEGDLTAFVQVVCGLYRAARWSPLPEFAGDAFYQVVYRVLVRRMVAPTGEKTKAERRSGVWVLRTFASTTERHVARRLLDREADYARIRLFVDGDPARQQYQTYRVRVEGENGPTHLAASFTETPATVPVPFGNLTDMTAFLTDRQEQFFRLSVPGPAVGLIPQRFSPVTAIAGQITEARIVPLVSAGVLTSEEIKTPQSVLLIPQVTVHAYPPRPVKLSA